MAIYPRQGEPATDPRRELEALRQEFRRLQVYLGVALAVIGIGTLLSVGLVAFYGFRVAERAGATDERVSRLSDETADTIEALSRAMARQQEEITAIRKAANDDLAAIQEANRKLAAIRDPRRELSALREANEALWQELASQRQALLDTLNENETPVIIPSAGRFQLGESYYTPPGGGEGLQGFVAGDGEVFRATEASSPANLLLEVEPRAVRLGDPYQLSIRLVNRSNQSLAPVELRLDWTFGTKNTGGPVTLKARRVAPRTTGLLYELQGSWTPAHEEGTASITATLALADGAKIQNTLRW